MNGRALRTLLAIGLLILSIVLAARGAALVAAAPLPTIATPTSAHITLEMVERASDPTTGETQEVTLCGEGDFDNARPAMQISYEMRLPADLAGTGQLAGDVSFRVVAVDDRLYVLDPTTRRWMWSALPTATATEGLVPDFSDLGTDFGGADFAFAPVGAETIDGAATTRWHMEFDFAKLFADPDRVPVPSASPLPPMLITYDLWIGNADTYVHRMAVGMNFSLPEEAGQGGGFSMSMAMTYSNFDQPVTIVAPADAAPMGEGTTAGDNFASGLLPGLSSLPLGGASFVLAGGGTATGLPSAPAASPTPRPNRGVGVGATAQPTATAKLASTPTPAATATRAATATATPPKPTATVAIAANASIPPTAAAPPPVAAAPAAQQPQAAPAGRSPLPLILGSAVLAALLALSGGLIVAGRRMR